MVNFCINCGKQVRSEWYVCPECAKLYKDTIIFPKTIYKSYMFWNLRCVKCGTKSSRLIPNKYKLPTCVSCAKKFRIWQTFLSIFVSLFSVALVLSFIVFYIISIRYEDWGVSWQYLMLISWLKTTISITIILFGLIVLTFLLRIRIGTNAKRYLRFEEGFHIKTKYETKWIPFQEWMEELLQKTDYSNEDISTFVQGMIDLQYRIRKGSNIKGRRLGVFFLLIGLLSLLILPLLIQMPKTFTFYQRIASIVSVVIGIGVFTYFDWLKRR